MLDWNALLARKYDILQQQADTSRTEATAAANLADTRAGLLPAESASNIAVNAANIGLTKSNARKTDEEAKQIAPLANANIFATRAQGRLYGSQATGEDQLNRLTNYQLRGLGNNLGVVEDLVRRATRFGLGPFAGGE